jgi:branched-chain amino acid transport system substrate-binding protein
MRLHPARFLALGAVAAMAASALAGCGGAATAQNGSNNPDVVVGISLPLTGQFSADGLAFDQGYKLWASDVNNHGGLLHRQVRLIILNDNSSQSKTSSQYKELITKDHVQLTLGPFSSLLTQPAVEAVGPYHYAMIEGAGDAQNVFTDPVNLKDHNVFSPSLPVVDYMKPLTDWIASLPASKRPTTAAYPSVNDPFALPAVQTAEQKLSKLGVKTVYYRKNGFTEATTTNTKKEEAEYRPFAEAAARAKAQLVVLGSVDVPTVQIFMQVFAQHNYVPKLFIATSGPDQGSAFEGPVGKQDANDMMVPDGWDGGYDNALSENMVEEYIAKYGGTAADVNADVAEAFSSGEVAADAVEHNHSFSNPKIISYLHTKGLTLQTVQGPATFNKLGQNPDAVAFVFQWQNGNFVQALTAGDPAAAHVDWPKTPWSS